MRILLDTNVIISALYSKKGASYYLLRACLSGKISYVVSPLIALEYEGKIMDKIADGFLSISRKDSVKILDAFFAGAEIVWEPEPYRPRLMDPSDDKILECAVSGSCTHIITFNKRHFPDSLTRVCSITIMTPGELLKIWREGI
jgi:putative PIN family toxin of toxin-antitoxin system